MSIVWNTGAAATRFRLKNKKRKMMSKFKEWLKQCPVEHDVILETSDEDVITINFHDKNIYEQNTNEEN